MEKIIKNITKIVILLFTFIILTACTPEKKFIGIWATDIFNQGNTREDAKSIVNSLSGNNLSGNILSILMNELHFNATMEIKEDGTLVMDSGMLFNANWKKDGNKITIDGANIYGIATLSEDQNTLYFENIIDKNSKPTNGITIGSKSITFEFKRVK